ncbi:SseB family protein [Streptomyces sp. ET3-23]|uniref:SseB family protein n=1 Tax=Streptomyces sp. ET3-23 TaxID=2885643 RepID=UPI001D1261E6|nr:SseB family protein [Streptomyces sp. ET3-23]
MLPSQSPSQPSSPRPAGALTEQVAAVHAGQGHPAAMIGEFRRTAVLVPLDEAGGLWSVEFGGIRWICAFTDETALARFAAAHGATAASTPVDREYRSVLGARLLDVVVPAVGGPAGVALDVAGERPMLFPPVTGIVPGHAAVDGVDDPEGAQ